MGSKYTFKSTAGATLAGVLTIVGLIWVATSHGACAWYGYQTDRETRYAAFVGCMVQVDTKWVPRSELRVAQ